MQETWVQSPSREDALKKEMTTHSSILPWGIPWTEKPVGLQWDMTELLNTTNPTNAEFIFSYD